MPAPLEVGKILFGAVALPWVRRADFARALAVPFALITFLGILQTLLGGSLGWPVLWGLLIVHLLAFVVFTVICHRLVLLENDAVVRRAIPQWTRRETRFLLRALAMWILCIGVGFALVLLFTFAVMPLVADGSAEKWVSGLLMPVALLPMFLLLGRLSPVLPATAVDRNVGLGWAWVLTAGNSWRMFVVVGVLPWLVSALTSLVAKLGPNVLATVVTTIVGSVLLIVEIAALSLAYRELTKDETPTSPPPPASPRTA